MFIYLVIGVLMCVTVHQYSGHELSRNAVTMFLLFWPSILMVFLIGVSMMGLNKALELFLD